MKGGFGNMQKMMKQVQKMQEDMQRIQAELADRTVTGSAGGGMVKAVVTCAQEMREIQIDPEVVDPAEIDMLQDLVVAAVNDALRKAQEESQAELGKITGGMKVPGLF
ncbi:MAG TPA: YbaB/EbfC family nucleoid-associated protein [Firmicutes bacterium]|nr:YbaB/EbfC family nucleoid-associated protein [Bacillota bacterium]